MGFDVLSFAMGQQAGKASGVELIENLPIAVDFSEGNQFVEAPEGQAVKSAVIQKPENLVAENIAEGVDIAGIIGTLTSGGGGGAVCKMVQVKVSNETTRRITVTHNLGVVPEFVIATAMSTYGGSDPATDKSWVYQCIGINANVPYEYTLTNGNTFINTSQKNHGWRIGTYSGKRRTYLDNGSEPMTITNLTDNDGVKIHDATETSIVIDSGFSNVYLFPAAWDIWFFTGLS